MDDLLLWKAIFSPYFHHPAHVCSLLGVDVATLPLLWYFIATEAVEKGWNRIHLVWTLFFLKTYPTVVMAEEWWGVSFKTWKHAIWEVIELINNHVDNVSNYVFLINLIFLHIT
jgi:hypothetical protein